MATQTAPAADSPPTHMLGAIVVTCLCFLPIGLVAVAFAWRTSTLNAAGDQARALRASRAARRWIIATVVVGLVVDLVLAAALALLGAFGS